MTITYDAIAHKLHPEALLLEPKETYNSCIVGVSEDKRAIYSANLIVNVLYNEIVQEKKDSHSYDSSKEADYLTTAIEHYYHNIEGSFMNNCIHLNALDLTEL
jgi:hypothetical protein